MEGLFKRGARTFEPDLQPIGVSYAPNLSIVRQLDRFLDKDLVKG
jgi:hypothetical protein